MTRPCFQKIFLVCVLAPMFVVWMSPGARAATTNSELQARLFSQARAVKVAAEQKEAAFFAPATYQNAVETLEKAEVLHEKGRSVEKIQESLLESVRLFERALLIGEEAEVLLAKSLAARQDAKSAQADSLYPKMWVDAERRLRAAIDLLEQGKSDKIERSENEVVALYKDMELQAIKAASLTETRALIKEADEQKIERVAPQTFRKAKELLAAADIELTENRYDLDLPRSLAREARYEAKHAFYIASQVKAIKERDVSSEEILLAAEKPLQVIAAAADIVAEFDKGSEPVTAAVVEHIERASATEQELRQQLADKEIQIAGMREILDEFGKIHGLSSTTDAGLLAYLDEQSQLLERLNTIESMFDRTEARVFRDAREIYIRLLGLTFPQGKDSIEAGSYALLDKVINALNLYPEAKIIVEGHTDSFGSDDANLILSRDRATAVRSYLIKASTIPAERIEGLGFGETKPIANNDTPQGRALNRRIDIRLVPFATSSAESSAD